MQYKMKNLSKVLAIILTSGLSVSAIASNAVPRNDKPKHTVSVSSNSTVNVTISPLSESNYLKVSALNETSSPVTISIFDNTGAIVYTEEVKTAEINRNYNLSSLPKDTYTIFVSSDNFSTYKEFVIK
jgi:biopolymer transport protein ExbD